MQTLLKWERTNFQLEKLEKYCTYKSMFRYFELNFTRFANVETLEFQ